MHLKTAQSKQLAQLREYPKTRKEINSITSAPKVREFTGRIKVSSTSRGDTDWELEGGTSTTIYYLIGDERRAARKFVKLHSDFVEICFNHGGNTPLHKLNDFIKDLIFQEYQIMKYNNKL